MSATAGYSGTPLPKKLGIKSGHRVLLVHAPAGFATKLAPLPDGVVVTARLAGTSSCDVIVLFASRAAELRSAFPQCRARLAETGGLWLAWPKKSAGVPTDLSEDPIRAVGLAAGLVDNKVCAIDEVWSGLRFVVRLADRSRGGL